MRTIILLLLSVLGAAAQTPPIDPGVSHELAKWRAARYSDVRYKLNLTLEKMSPVLKGTIEIRVKVNAAPGEQGTVPWGVPIVLDWRKIRGSESLSTVSNASVNGENVTPLQGAGRVLDVAEPVYENRSEHLIFMDAVRPGENVIKLDFTSPILTSGSAITRYVDKEDGAEYIYSLFVPSDASTAFPVFDQPDLKARFELVVRAPSEWKIVSNGLECGPILDIRNSHGQNPNPESMMCHNETKPISTYVFAFAAGPFERVSEGNAAVPAAVGEASRRPDGSARRTLDSQRDAGVTTHVFVRKSQAAKFKPHAAEVFRLNREGIKYLEAYFDYKFPFPQYDLVLIPEFPFGGMEHAGATFLREDRVIFPQEPTKNDYITRANLIFHEAAHQWFGDTVTMKWFDDLWLKEGFAEFMAYKTLEKVMPEYNAWKIFYERNKQAAYLTDSTKGTTPIYQEIANLNAAKSAYGNIVYRKAPSFLKQAEFYIGPDKFQGAVRSFLKKYEFANAGWEDLVKEFETASGRDLKDWANVWVKQRGVPTFRTFAVTKGRDNEFLRQENSFNKEVFWHERLSVLLVTGNERRKEQILFSREGTKWDNGTEILASSLDPDFVFPNYQDYGYGIFLLDAKSRDYVLKNIQNEKDDFLRAMMWGSLWDSVREGELDPKEYVELVISVLSPDFSRPTAAKRPAKAGTQNVETDESTIQTLLGRVSTAMRYYMAEPRGGSVSVPPAVAGGTDLGVRLEDMLIDRMQNALTPGQRITYYRYFLSVASSANARRILKLILKGGNPSGSEGVLKVGDKNTLPTGRVSASMPRSSHSTKDRFDIVARLIILGDPEAPKLLADLEKTETSDEAKRYAYAAKAGVATAENKAKYWSDFTTDKDISESWIEAAFGPFNSVRQNELTLPYLEKALAELPNLKRSRKIFFVNGWLGAFIGGQKSEEALAIVNKFLADNPKLDNDLRLKVLENVDLIERAVKIRGRFGKA